MPSRPTRPPVPVPAEPAVPVVEERFPYVLASAFAAHAGGGNPAAIGLLPRWPADLVLATLSAEHLGGEMAFVGPGARRGEVRLRWFAARRELDLCGHATLAAAAVLAERDATATEWRFRTRAGTLPVRREGAGFWLRLPARPLRPIPAPLALRAWLGGHLPACHMGRDLVVDLPDEDRVRALQPDFSLIARLEGFGLAVTAPGRDCDYVVRYFAPKIGVPEDAATGAIHASLAPLWAERLGRTELRVRQLSGRGGAMLCRRGADGVEVGGDVRIFARGEACWPLGEI